VYGEDDLLPISALQHLLFCERQAALIHVDGLWAENRLTTEGQHLHEKAHEGPDESHRGRRLVRGLPLHSYQLGLFGVADVVEFDQEPTQPPHDEPANPPLPIEYKRGESKTGDFDRVQLCSQAMCLEEMLKVTIQEGAVFYGQTRRRERVELTDALRAQTSQAAQRLHELVASQTIPRVKKQKKCDRCSLLHLCLPAATAPNRSASQYLQRSLAALDT
jgi:CRISPR-associated exonuclease Cas4